MVAPQPHHTPPDTQVCSSAGGHARGAVMARMTPPRPGHPSPWAPLEKLRGTGRDPQCWGTSGTDTGMLVWAVWGAWEDGVRWRAARMVLIGGVCEGS